MNQTEKPKAADLFLRIILGIFGLLLVGGFYFTYVALPQKVAQGIMEKGKTRKPLTQSPKDYGLPYQDVSFITADGVSLSGWWLPAPSGKKPLGTILLSHGVFKNREQVLSRADFLVKAGYQALLFDHRGNGMSGDSPTSGGLMESKDYSAALQFLKDKHRVVKPLVLFGFSMGAMSALRAAAVEPEVEAVVADSPLANIRSYVSRRTMGGSFTALPGFLSRCLKAYDSLSGLSLTEGDLDLVPVVQSYHDLPVIYITGEGDDLAKSEEVRKLFEKTVSTHRRLVYVPEAGHEETFAKFPIIYRKSVMEFLTDLRNGFPKPKDFPESAGTGTKKEEARRKK